MTSENIEVQKWLKFSVGQYVQYSAGGANQRGLILAKYLNIENRDWGYWKVKYALAIQWLEADEVRPTYLTIRIPEVIFNRKNVWWVPAKFVEKLKNHES